MRKKDFAEKITQKIGKKINVEDSLSVINILIDELGIDLKEGKRITISNLGRFTVKTYAPYKSKRIFLGVEMKTYPYKLLRFKPLPTFLAYLKSEEKKS